MRKMGDTAFQALLDAACAEGHVFISEGSFSHPRAGKEARRREEQEAERLFGMLKEAGGAPPTTSELIAATGTGPSLAHRALGILEKQGRIRRVNRNFCFTVEALTELETKVREHLRANGNASVTELKDAMLTSRKYAVPLLEFFDAQGITSRAGDLRRLR
jgi:selenocysteine-specific elongation factor